MPGLAKVAAGALVVEPLVAGAVALAVPLLLVAGGGWGIWWLLSVAATLPIVRWLRWGYRLAPFDLPALLVLLGAVIGTIGSPEPELSQGGFQSLLANSLVYLALAHYPPGQVKRLAWLVATGLGAGSLLVLPVWLANPWLREITANFFRLLPYPGEAVAAIYRHGTSASVTVVGMAICLAGVALLDRRPRARLVAAGLALFLMLTLVGSPSNGAWVTLSAGIFFLLLWKSWWALLSLPLLAAMVAWSLTLRVGRPLEQLVPVASRLVEVRFIIWERALKTMNGLSWQGEGLGVMREPTSHSLHSAYLQLFADTGILGLLALLLGAAICLRLLFRLRGRDGLWAGWAVTLMVASFAIAFYGVFEASPMGHASQLVGKPYYVVSPFFWLLGGLLGQAFRGMEKGPAYGL